MLFLSRRSRRKHKAWGGSPRVNVHIKEAGARDSGRKLVDSRCRPFDGLRVVFLI